MSCSKACCSFLWLYFSFLTFLWCSPSVIAIGVTSVIPVCNWLHNHGIDFSERDLSGQNVFYSLAAIWDRPKEDCEALVRFFVEKAPGCVDQRRSPFAPTALLTAICSRRLKMAAALYDIGKADPHVLFCSMDVPANDPDPSKKRLNALDHMFSPNHRLQGSDAPVVRYELTLCFRINPFRSKTQLFFALQNVFSAVAHSLSVQVAA
jgi:hypothetical protein